MLSPPRKIDAAKSLVRLADDGMEVAVAVKDSEAERLEKWRTP